MHVHILGICGTFMAGVAQLARALGHKVTGSDAGVYPPMSDVLADAGISVFEGYDPAQFAPVPDVVVIGNALSRGNPAVEHVLNTGLAYESGPEWIRRHALAGRHVIAVAGTHGKTTTTSLIAWLLNETGHRPGYLVGGMVPGLGNSAALGDGATFVIEADEYDTAFFDKRSKFVHYQPRTLVLNNLEFDHADIFADLAAIETQFHHLVRTVPGTGRILAGAPEPALDRVLARGVWTEVQRFGDGADCAWRIDSEDPSWREFTLHTPDGTRHAVASPLLGHFNARNICAALAAASHGGAALPALLEALPGFTGVKRRLEVVGTANGITVYDDFAHHPTAIRATLSALRATLAGRAGGRIVAVMEPRSNTMRMGVHGDALGEAFADADRVLLYLDPALELAVHAPAAGPSMTCLSSHEEVVTTLAREARPGDHVLVMSNGGFGGMPRRLLAALAGTA